MFCFYSIAQYNLLPEQAYKEENIHNCGTGLTCGVWLPQINKYKLNSIALQRDINDWYSKSPLHTIVGHIITYGAAIYLSFRRCVFNTTHTNIGKNLGKVCAEHLDEIHISIHRTCHGWTDM